jgi:SAM-dependent methyltransferase
MSRSAGEPDYLRPYADAVRASGPTFGSLLWRSEEFQRKRFEVIDQMVPLRGRVVADIGCGRADLMAYLVEHGAAPARYIGVEGVAALAEECRRLAVAAGWADAAFHEADFVADPALFDRLASDAGVDVFVFSGSLNTLEERDASRVVARALAALRRAGRGDSWVVFNFLSNLAPGKRRIAPTGPAHRFDTLRVLRRVLSRTPGVRFRHDYLGGHDATIAATPRDRRSST